MPIFAQFFCSVVAKISTGIVSGTVRQKSNSEVIFTQTKKTVISLRSHKRIELYEV